MMRKILVAVILLMLSMSKAWASCDEVYTKKIDYLKGTEIIAIQIQTLKTPEGRAEKHIDSMKPKIIEAIAAQIPKYSNIKVVNYQPDADISLPSEKSVVLPTSIFKFVIKPWQGLPAANFFVLDITLYLAKQNAAKDVAYKEAIGIILASDAEEHFMEFIKQSTQDIVSTIICLHDKVCPPPKPCNDPPLTRPKKSNSEDDIIQRMKALE